jgi:hypothetical protein
LNSQLILNEAVFMKLAMPVKSACVLSLLFFSVAGFAAEEAEENASDPLAKVRNTDVRWQYFDTDDSHINDVFIDGAFMANDQLKIKYEVHYWETDVTGDSEQNLESTTIKAIYFPKDIAGEGGRNYRVAAGLDWIVDHGEEDKGIGSGSDQLAPYSWASHCLRKRLVFDSAGTALYQLQRKRRKYNRLSHHHDEALA